MKIGVFDSGLGGLIVACSLMQALPEYDYIYLGDTKRVPYGNRSQETVYEFTKEAVQYLFEQGCQLIIIACNTASAEALPRIQQEYLPATFPDRRVLGMIRPTSEQVLECQSKRVGVLATASTVSSRSYSKELAKLDPTIQVFQQAAPLLVPLVENNGMQWVEPILNSYLQPLLSEGVDSLILGCTHYAALKTKIREMTGGSVTVLSQDEIIPAKLADYLQRHQEIRETLTTNKGRTFLVTDRTENLRSIEENLLGQELAMQVVEY